MYLFSIFYNDSVLLKANYYNFAFALCSDKCEMRSVSHVKENDRLIQQLHETFEIVS